MVWETGIQSQVKSYQRLKKWYLIPLCFNTQHYKVHIKGKVKQSRRRSSALPYTLVQQLLKRELSGRPRLQSPSLLYLWLKRKLTFDKRLLGVFLFMSNAVILSNIHFDSIMFH